MVFAQAAYIAASQQRAELDKNNKERRTPQPLVTWLFLAIEMYTCSVASLLPHCVLGTTSILYHKLALEQESIQFYTHLVWKF